MTLTPAQSTRWFGLSSMRCISCFSLTISLSAALKVLFCHDHKFCLELCILLDKFIQQSSWRVGLFQPWVTIPLHCSCSSQNTSYLKGVLLREGESGLRRIGEWSEVTCGYAKAEAFGKRSLQAQLAKTLSSFSLVTKPSLGLLCQVNLLPLRATSMSPEQWTNSLNLCKTEGAWGLIPSFSWAYKISLKSPIRHQGVASLCL